jgi:AraC-type DNA-binding domain-containing proteins
MKMKSKSVAMRWFLSYITILALSIVVGVVIYSYSYNVISTQTERVYGGSMRQVKMEIDGRVKEIQQMLDQVSLNKNVKTAIRIKDKAKPEDHFVIIDIIDQINKYIMTYSYIDDVFVVLNGTDYIISATGYMSQELFYKLYYESEEYSLEQFKDMMKSIQRNNVIKYTILNDKESLLFMKSIVDSPYSEEFGTVVISLNQAKMVERLENVRWDNSIGLYILDRSDVLIAAADEGFSPEFKYSNVHKSEEFKIINIDGQDYGMLVNESDIKDWKYISLTPTALLKENANLIRYITLFGLLICTLFGVFLSYYLTKYNYSPLNKLMNLFNSSVELEKAYIGNEYIWLEEKAKKFFEEKGVYEHTVWSNLRMLRKYYLYTLLEQPFDIENGEGEIQRYKISLKPVFNVVVLFKCAIPEQEILSDEDSNNINIRQYIISNIFEEIGGEHFNIETTNSGRCVAAVISFPSDSEELLNTLQDDIVLTQQKVMEFFKFELIAAIGEVHKGFEGIYYSNREAKEALQYVDKSGGQDIVLYREVKDMNYHYQYPLEVEQKLINLMKIGESVAACELISHIFKLNAENKVSGEVKRCMAFDILGTVIKGMGQFGSSEYLDNKDINISDVTNDGLEGHICRAVSKICEKAKEQSERADVPQLSKSIKDYVESNYRDPDLNISLTALHFNMTPSYLSVIFKEETGLGLLDYINTIRIEECKKHLLDGVSVVEIADMTGFRGSGALIRVFKKLTGITPGQYKKINHTTICEIIENDD